MESKKVLSLLPIIAIFLLAILSYSLIQISEKKLENIYPIFLITNIGLITFFLYLSRHNILECFKKIEKRTWKILLIILILAFFIRMFVAPHAHRIYFDEDIYLNIAQNIANEGKACLCDYGTPRECFSCISNKQPYGAPAFYSIFFMIFGVSEKVAIAVSIIISTINILLIFLISYLLFKKDSIALYSAFVFSLIPIHILWSATQSLDIMLVFFSSLAILTLLLYLEKKSTPLLFTFFFSLSYACQIRPESLLMAAVAAVFIITLDKNFMHTLKDKRFLLALSLFLILIIPTVKHTLNMKEEDWGASNGKKFDLRMIRKNFIDNSNFFFDNERFPVLFTIAAVAGLVIGMLNFKRRILPFLIWFLLFFFVFIPFYAGSFDYGQDVRFSLNLYPAIAIFCGLGFHYFSIVIKILVEKNTVKKHSQVSEDRIVLATLFIIAIAVVPFTRMISEFGEESWECLFYHDFIIRNVPRIKDHCIVVSHVSSMFLVKGVASIQTHTAIDQKMMQEIQSRYGCVLFDEGYWCVNSPEHREGICKKFKEQNFLSVYSQETQRDKTYTLYRVYP